MEHHDFSQINLQKDDSKAAIVNRNCRKQESEHRKEKHPEHKLINCKDLRVYSFLKHVVLLTSEET